MKCYAKLVDIAQSLIKMAPYDQSCIKSTGLQKYMNEVFPITDWSQEALRPALTTIIRRLVSSLLAFFVFDSLIKSTLESFAGQVVHENP